MTHFKGLNLPKDWHKHAKAIFGVSLYDPAVALPAYFNWQDTNPVPVRDQGQAGTCYAHGTTDVGNYRYSILNGGSVIAIAPQWLVSHDTDDDGVNGGNVSLDMLCGRQDGCGQSGVVYEADDPYTATDADKGCPLNRQWTAQGWAYVPFSDQVTQLPSVSDIKAAIMANGPVTTAVDADDAWQNYHGGGAILQVKVSAPQSADHLVVIVGWDDSKSAWIVKNSWSESWGNAGFVFVPYGSYNAGLASAYLSGNITPIVAPTPTPTPAPVKPWWHFWKAQS